MTHRPSMRARGALLAAALVLGGTGSLTAARADDGAPPAVARISVVGGDVGVKQGDAKDQVAAAVNAPLEAGDYVTTGSDGRVEIQLDPSNVVRADANTQIRFTQLDGSQDTVQLAQGTVELRVLQAGADRVSLQSPSVDVVPNGAGAYLVTVDSNGQTFVTARSGSLNVDTPQGSQTLNPGRTMQITGSANNPQYQFINEIASNDFENWANGLDQQLAAANTSPYVNSDMLGASDLDQYGNWTNVSGYGNVWQPNDVPPNWSPYSSGSWVYQNYYGWTWVAAEPWGWAPYHYGRWAYIGDTWCWVPGPVDAAPVYAPALVAFFGFGGGIGIGFNFGNVGWVPLGPGDPFNPWWGGNTTTIVVNNTTIINNYQNVNPGLVGLPVVGWQNGNFNQITRLHTTQLRDLHPVVGRLPLNPTNNNYRFTRSPIGTTVAKPVYTRFRAIQPIRPTNARGTVSTIPRAPVSNGWQRFTTTRTSTPGFTPARRTNSIGTPARGSAWQHFSTAPVNRLNAYQPTSQRPTYRQQQPTSQRPTYQQQRPTYQRPVYQQPTQTRPVYQPPQQAPARPTYQRQTSDQRTSTPSRAPRPRETAEPHSHGPGTM